MSAAEVMKPEERLGKGVRGHSVKTEGAGTRDRARSVWERGRIIRERGFF